MEINHSVPLSQLIDSVDSWALIGDPSIRISHMTSDSRRVRPGSLFAALPGTAQNGAHFIRDAIERGAAAIVTSSDEENFGGIVMVQVPDPRNALARMAAAFYHQPAKKLQLIGITGTDGKTSVTYIVSRMLSLCGIPCAYIGTLGAEIGGLHESTTHTTPIPEELHRLLCWSLDNGAAATAVEASSHGLRQQRLAGLHFRTAVFTKFGRDHLDYHTTSEDYLSSKLLLFESLAADGVGVANADQPKIAASILARAGNALTYSAAGRQSDIKVTARQVGADGVKMALAFREKKARLKSGLLGDFQVENLAAAAATGIAMGIPLPKVIAGLESVSFIPGRFQPIRHGGRLCAIVDYAHTPGALENALQSARKLTSGKVIVVFGCGGNRDRGKRPLMGRIAEDHADTIILTNDNPRYEKPMAIIQEIKRGMKASERTFSLPDRREALALAVKRRGIDDLILVAGKGHEKSQEIQGIMHPFDDVDEIENLLPSCGTS